MSALALPASGYILRLKLGQPFQLDSQLAFVRDVIAAQADRDYFARRFDCLRDELLKRGVARLTTQALWPEILHGMRRWTPAKEAAGDEEAIGPAAFKYEPLPGNTISRTLEGRIIMESMLEPIELLDAPLRPAAKSLTFYKINGMWWAKVVWGRNRRRR